MHSWVLFTNLIVAAMAKLQHDPGTPLPSFGDPINNITTIKGRDISFTCIVKDLGKYKVGWVKADTKAIQAIHHQVVTHNPRVSVSYRDRTTWKLLIKNVQEDDRGLYMCQVNSDPMIAELAYLEVVVPPEIVDEESSGETEVDEGGSITLSCKAIGHPHPKLSWQREKNHKITLREQSSKKVKTVEGEYLNLTKVKRQDMGPYLCIGKNGIPPSVSKRIMLVVNFKPLVEVPVNMFGSPLGSDVTITCKVESSPKSVNTWRKIPGEQMIISSIKYNETEEHIGYYLTKMHLTIKNFTKEDATKYICSASNSLGYSESSVQVYEIPTPITSTDDNSEDKEKYASSLENKHNHKQSEDQRRVENMLENYTGKKGFPYDVSSGEDTTSSGDVKNEMKAGLNQANKDSGATNVRLGTEKIFNFFSNAASIPYISNYCAVIAVFVNIQFQLHTLAIFINSRLRIMF